MIQPRLGATWAYDGTEHRLTRATRSTTRRPARCRAPPPGTATVGDVRSTRYFDANGVLFAHRPVGLLVGQAVRAGHDAAHDQGVPVRHGAAVRRPLDRRGSTAATASGSHFWEDTNNNARRGLQPAAPASRASCTSRTSTAQLAQIGSGRPTSSPSSTALHEVLRGDGGDRVARRQDVRPRLVHLEPLLRQLRPGQLDRRVNDANIFIGSSNIGDGAGRQLWDFKDGDLRGDRPHCSRSTATYQLAWNAQRGAFLIAQSGQPWEAGATSPTEPHDLHERHEPLRGAGRLAPDRRALPARPELHAELPAAAPAATLQLAPTCSTSSTARPATTFEPSVHNSAVRHSRRTTSTRGACQLCVQRFAVLTPDGRPRPRSGSRPRMRARSVARLPF